MSKTLTANFTTEKNKLNGAEPRTLIEIDTDSGTLYYSDQPITVGAQSYTAKIMKWGTVRSQVIPGDSVVRLSDMPIELSNNPRIDSDIRPGIEVRMYIWFVGLAVADKLLYFRGIISDKIKWNYYTIEFNCMDIGEYWDKKIGTVLKSDDYPYADPDDIGNIIPEIHGSVEYSPCLAAIAGAISTIADEEGIVAGASTIVLADASRFPEAGQDYRNLIIGDDDGITYTGKSASNSNQLIGVSGVTKTYPQGTPVFQGRDLTYLAANHAVKSLSNPRIIPTGLDKKAAVSIADSGVTLTEDNGGQATVEIASSAFASIRRKVNLAINPGGHFHYVNTSESWEVAAEQVAANKDYVFALAVFNNELYGGTDDEAWLVKWNSVTRSWSKIDDAYPANTHLRSLYAFNGKLYAGTYIDGALWEYDGVTFAKVASYLNLQIYIHSLVEFNNELYGGTGDGGRLFKWDGVSAWTQVAGQLNGQAKILSLCVFNNKIYGGTSSGGRLFESSGGAWTQVAGQLNGQTDIYGLAVWNNELYGCTAPGGRLFKWNGVGAWTQVAGQFSTETYLLSLVVYNNRLYAGSYPGGKLLRLNEAEDAWELAGGTLDAQDQLYGLTVFNGKLYAGTGTSGKLFEYQSDLGYGDLNTIDYYNDTAVVGAYQTIDDPENVADENAGSYADIHHYSAAHGAWITAQKTAAEDPGESILRMRAKALIERNSGIGFDRTIVVKGMFNGIEVSGYKDGWQDGGYRKVATGETATLVSAWINPEAPEWADFNNTATAKIWLQGKHHDTGPILGLKVYEMWWEIETYDEVSGDITSTTYLSIYGNSVADTLGGQLVVDIEGYQDDGAGHYTGTPNALIEKPSDMFHHLIENHSNGATHSDIDIAGSFADALSNLPSSYSFGFGIYQQINLNQLLAMLAQQCWCRFVYEAGLAKLNRIKFSGTSSKSLDTDDDSYLKDNNELDVVIESSNLNTIYNNIEIKYNLDWSYRNWRNEQVYQLNYSKSDATSVATYGDRQQTFLFFAIGNNEAMVIDLQNKYLVFYKDPRQKITFPTFLKHVELERGDVSDITCSQLGLSAKDHEIINIDYLPPVPTEKQPPTIMLGMIDAVIIGYAGGGWGAQPWGA